MPASSYPHAGQPLPDTRQPTFRARGLTRIYHVGAGEIHALRGVDLDVFPGEFVVLLGPSGSGKSTLLNILGGLDTPTASRRFSGGSFKVIASSSSPATGSPMACVWLPALRATDG